MSFSVVLAGATGLVGKSLLNQLLECPDIGQITSFGRRKIEIEHPKLNQQIIDFENFTVDISADFLFCCVGTTISKAGSQANFRKVDYEIPNILAQWAVNHKVSTFIGVSSLGAKAAASNFYLRTKGEMEEMVKSYPIPRIAFVRPSLLLGKRREFRIGEKLASVLFPIFSVFLVGNWRKYRAIKAENVAKAMIRIALQDDLKGVFLSDELEKMTQ